MAAPPAAAAKRNYQPQCAALTEGGKQCRNSSRGSSKYCASHKGYQPPALKGLAQRIEGDSWSPKDKRSDSASRVIADTKPAVGRADDTRLAVRGKGRRKARAIARPARAAPARAPARTPARATSTRSTSGTAPRRMPATREDAFVATILQPQRDYLVVYEEPDPDGMHPDDALLLDIDAGQPVSLGEVDLEQKLDLELSNNTNRTGTVGFVLAIVGAVIALIACVIFAVAYPDPWYTTSGSVSGSGLIPGTVLVGIIGALTMLAGVILTHYGRRIQARGNLSRMRIVEKSFQPRVALGEET